MSHGQKPTCFIAMPVRTRQPEIDEFGDPEHWIHVMNALFIKAVQAAGYQEVVPKASGAWLIHDRIITNLVEADMVLCDMSALNSNVFFELGVRTALNKPIALVYDGRSELSFDTSGINTYTYKVPLEYWSMDEHVAELAQHIRESAESCAGENPLWRQFGLKITAQEPSASETPLEAKLDLLLDTLPAVRDLQARNEVLIDQLNTLEEDFEARLDRRTSQSKHPGPVGLATQAIERYARDQGIPVTVHPTLGGGLTVVAPSSIQREDRYRIRELGLKYGVVVSMQALNRDGQRLVTLDRSETSPPTADQFMQSRPPEDEDDDS